MIVVSSPPAATSSEVPKCTSAVAARIGCRRARVRSGGENRWLARVCRPPAAMTGTSAADVPRSRVDQPAILRTWPPASVPAARPGRTGIDGSQRLVEGPDLYDSNAPASWARRARSASGCRRSTQRPGRCSPASNAATSRNGIRNPTPTTPPPRQRPTGGQLAVQLVRHNAVPSIPSPPAPAATARGGCAHRPHRRELDRGAASDGPVNLSGDPGQVHRSSVNRTRRTTGRVWELDGLDSVAAQAPRRSTSPP